MYFFLDLNWGTLQKLVSGMETKPLLITATDGNHGYALAFAAKLLGCEAIIFMPKVKKAVLTINKLHTMYLKFVAFLENMNFISVERIGGDGT